MKIIAKGYYGMGGNISVLVTSIMLANRLGAEVCVDWEKSVYGVEGKDIYDHLFKAPINDLSFKKESSLRVWPEYWQEYYKETMPYKVVDGNNLVRVSTDTVLENDVEAIKENFDAIVLSRDSSWWHKAVFGEECRIALDSLTPSDLISKKMERYELENDPIAVHFRHGNGEPTVVPPDINWFFKQVDDFLGVSPHSKIFLCTDCIKVLEVFEERYGSKVCYTEKHYGPLGSGAMHSNSDDVDRLRSAEEAVVDIWLMGKCKYFVGSKSFFTTTAMKLANAEPSNIKVWNPIYRSHRKEPDKESVSMCSVISRMFDEICLPMDGVFYSRDNDGYHFYYLYDFLYSSSRLDEVDMTSIRELLKSKRLY